MLNHAEGLAPHSVWNAYREEEAMFMKTVREISINKVQKGSNIIKSYVIYKFKANVDGSLKMKARIAPHVNKDKDRDMLKTASAQCPPTAMRILASIATIMKWPLASIDFVSAFLRTGDAERDVYAIPLRECRRRSKYWLLLTSAYGLFNANAKWEEHFDHLLASIRFIPSRLVPQMFFLMKSESLEFVALRIVDDVLIASQKHTSENFISNVEIKYKLGTILYGPIDFLSFSLQVGQDSDMAASIHGDSKLNALECFLIDRYRRKQIDEALNEIETRAFR